MQAGPNAPPNAPYKDDSEVLDEKQLDRLKAHEEAVDLDLAEGLLLGMGCNSVTKQNFSGQKDAQAKQASRQN